MIKIPIAKPLIDAQERQAVDEVLTSGMLAHGPKVEEFEKAFAEFVGSGHAVATSNGTTALQAALRAMGVGEGDEVITSSFTFAASATSILDNQGLPVFADIDSSTFNIDPNSITEKITPKTKAIMPVHLYGYPADMVAINRVAKEHDLLILEDAAQAHGAEISGKKVGTMGDAGSFSFYPTKNMTTGEGGMVVTDSQTLASKVRAVINHGQTERYKHDVLGFNYRMTSIAAAIGLVQLKKLGEFTEKRRANAEFYNQNITRGGILKPTVQDSYTHVYHQYTIRVTPAAGKSRDEVVAILTDKGIGTGIYYPIPLHQQKLFLDLGYKDSLPNTEAAAKEVISIPVHPALSKDELEYIVETINGI